MDRLQRLLISSAATILVACGGSDEPSTREVPFSQVKWRWEPTESRQTYTLRTDDEWLAAWKASTPPSHPLTLRPQVDFTRHMVLGVVQASAPSGGYSLTIVRVTEVQDRIQVEYKMQTPRPEFTYTFAVVSLADFVVIERIDKPVLFLRTDA